VLRRLEAVRVVLAEERWTPKVRAQLCELFAVGDSQLWKDRARINTEDLRLFDEDLRVHRMQLTRKLRHVYTRTLDAKEHGFAIQAIDKEAKVLGAYAPQRMEHSGGVELTVTGAQAVAGDPLAHAREILDPRMQAWARAMLAAHNETIPNVIEVPALETSADDRADD
jgi:hypothetical protein